MIIDAIEKGNEHVKTVHRRMRKKIEFLETGALDPYDEYVSSLDEWTVNMRIPLDKKLFREIEKYLIGIGFEKQFESFKVLDGLFYNKYFSAPIMIDLTAVDYKDGATCRLVEIGKDVEIVEKESVFYEVVCEDGFEEYKWN